MNNMVKYVRYYDHLITIQLLILNSLCEKYST